MLEKRLPGLTVSEASRIDERAILEALGTIPPNKVHACVLAEDAVIAILEKYREVAS
ncbi:MAG: iron-sulfur cluster assembly scaffold protein [Armatimonadetes bacterium]|nr:iron-sulfur cluster assembly scaffold protein [Armatimonadota bacterium]